MKSEEFNLGELVDAIFTSSDGDACSQLGERTGLFLNMFAHCAKFHPKVLTAAYLGELFSDLDHLQMQYRLPQPKQPGMH